MKQTLQIISSLFLLLVGTGVYAQSSANLVVFSENGENFLLTVDGVKINDRPQSNVKATGLTGEFHRVGVQFEDASLGNVSQNIMLEAGMETKAVVKLTKKGYAVRPFGLPVSLAEATTDAPAPVPPVVAETPRSRQQHAVPAESLDAEIQTTTVTTTTTSAHDTERVKMDVGIGDMKVGIDVKVSDGGMGTSTTVRTTETTTVNTTVRESAVAPRETARTTPETKPAPACGPMAGADFADAKKSIANGSFEDTKMTTAKQVIRGNCMSTDQIKDVLKLFSFEESKLDFAKAAHSRCSDPQNYWKLNDAFTFSSSVEDLNEFLQKK